MNNLKTINKLAMRGLESSKTSVKDLELQRIVMLSQPIQLNDNQKVVLEWLEECYAKSQWPFPFYVLKHAANDMPANIFDFYDDFTMKEEFEVLAAFSQWGLEQEAVNEK